ncbi:uncharacterized protein N7500_006274 [Penicillium coprophilum]|uniref:uncharacterized protein n=1 Tax=Penicillium coprophilum TaxID=36646 RepID=UPI00239BB96C|nr:uncharacterized protein N7500_006274 [Penicillium coprophilum]KAJ5164444.1 hypothetical protein N7500_006274 [Penicillium coprophilum]
MESSERPPPLLQRPESSGIDVLDFSFSKPASHKPSYSRSLAKQPPMPHHAIDNSRPSREPMGEGDYQISRPDTPSNQCSVVKEGISTAPIAAGQPIFTRPPSRLSTAAGPNKDSGSRSTPRHLDNPSFRKNHEVIICQPKKPTGADIPRETVGSAGSVVGLSAKRVVDIDKMVEAEPVLSEPPHVQGPHKEGQDIPENPCSRVPLMPVHNQPHTSTRRRVSEKEPSSKQPAPLVGGKNGVQLSEDHLFELLITKMRQREESEQAAAAIQRQLKNENMALREDNLNMQDRLKRCQGQLARTSIESRSQRAQIDKWKAKLGTFKGVLNELGREYDTVREQATELKAATISLGREKSEIQDSLDEIKLKLSKSEEIMRNQRERLSTSEHTVANLREALDHSEKRGDLIKLQLTNENKRIATLEAYIQNESQSQSRCLALVRNDQRRMAENFDSACELFTTSCIKSQDEILSKLSPALEHCIASVQTLKEQCSSEVTNVQAFTSSVQEVASRFNSLAGQVTSDVDRSTEMNKNVFQALQEALRAIESNIGPYSSISKQLANNESCCGNLQQQLQIFEPMLGSLEASIKAVGMTETGLVCGLETFGQKLSEAQIPAGNPVLEMEVSKKFAENTQLQLQLQEISLEVESLRKQLASKASENEHLQHALTDAVTNEQASKSQSSRLEIENTALQGELQFLEQRIREELGAASTKLQGQMKARVEEQVQGLETERARLENYSSNLQAQLANVQRSLIETKRTAEDERLEKASMHQESQKRIEALDVSCSKYITEAKAMETRSQLLKSSEAALLAERERLLEQLEQAKVKTIELEANLGMKTESAALKEKATQEAERRAQVLELETTQKTEELATMKKTVAMLESRSSALEKVGEEADAEIISLLRRAQEAENWQATIREGFAKVIDVPPDEPFEQTWQKLEDIIQSPLAQLSITGDTPCTRLDGTASMEGAEGTNLTIEPRESRHVDSLDTDGSNNKVRKPVDQMQTDGHLASNDLSPRRLRNMVIVLTRCQNSLLVTVIFLHDRLSREDSLSLFNDPAELEMLLMSTPDLQGHSTTGDDPKKNQEQQKIEPLKMNRNTNEADPVFRMEPPRADDGTTERPQSAVENVDSSVVDKSANNQQANIKRKVVSFEGTRVFTKTEVGKARRMSDATDNSSGRESESKEVKKTHKRTYSRLRQSIAQEETSIEATSEGQPASKTLVGDSQQSSMKKTGHPSNAHPRPPKRPRNASDGPERRLSPKGLASGSSRGNAAGQASISRGRGKRRTREGDRYNERFSQDVG